MPGITIAGQTRTQAKNRSDAANALAPSSWSWRLADLADVCGLSSQSSTEDEAAYSNIHNACHAAILNSNIHVLHLALQHQVGFDVEAGSRLSAPISDADVCVQIIVVQM